MVQSKFDIKVHSILRDWSPEILNDGIFLWIIQPNEIPPHIGISIDGYYFSLKLNGVDLKKDVNQFYNLILKKEISCLLCSITSFISESEAEQLFSEQKKLEIGTTCLDPIKRLLDYCEVKTIHELLDSLSDDKKLGRFLGMNLNSDFAGIRSYTREDVLKILKSSN